jgi:hypothetical protein
MTSCQTFQSSLQCCVLVMHNPSLHPMCASLRLSHASELQR